jgi:hypothetical protein
MEVMKDSPCIACPRCQTPAEAESRQAEVSAKIEAYQSIDQIKLTMTQDQLMQWIAEGHLIVALGQIPEAALRVPKSDLGRVLGEK